MTQCTITYDGDTHWLECDGCNEPLCTVEAGDSWESLALTVDQHECPNTATAPTSEQP
jgi:hypothetical protein